MTADTENAAATIASKPNPAGRLPGRLFGYQLDLGALAVLAILPLMVADVTAGRINDLLIFAILALGLNVVVGYTGLLHLGIGAFFGIGAYITGIVTVTSYPLQFDFVTAMVFSTLGAAACGLMLGAPTLRLRGDYLALVTLGFGEVVNTSLRNLEEITNGTRSLGPVPPASLPRAIAAAIGADQLEPLTQAMASARDYYLTLVILVGIVLFLRNLEHSKLGRAWVALREDELAAKCMAIDTPRAKLAAFAISAAIAGLAGCLYATRLRTTASPDTYGFSLSITVLCCVILGGLGSIRGTLLGVFLLKGYELLLAPWLDQAAQGAKVRAVNWLTDSFPTHPGLISKAEWLLTFTNWKLMIFGLALIVTVRFRPEGLLPSRRVQQEIEEFSPKPRSPQRSNV